MRTTKFGYEILKSAESVLGQGYRSGKKNYYGEKLEDIIKEYDSVGGTKYYAGKGRQQPDYCAITASVILDRAFKNYDGSKNVIRNASANNLAVLAKKSGVRVDGNPAIGSLFIYERNDKGQGHIGFVWKSGHKNYIETIEGNTESCSSFIIKEGCATKLNCGEYGILTRQRKSPYITSAKKKYSFIHIEELYGTSTQDYPDTVNYLADGEYCEIINEDDFNFAEGSDGDAEDPKETHELVQFFHTHMNKILLGGGVLSIILLGVLGGKK